MARFADLVSTYIPTFLAFPKHFTTWIPGQTPFSTIESGFAMIVTYLVVIFGIQAILADQPPLKLDGLFRAHNLILCIGSVLLFGLFFEEVIPIIWNNGLFHSICSEEAWTPRLEFYYILNYYFKYVELIDTVFLALRKRPLRFLHVYHHAATALLSYNTFTFRGSLSWTIATINLAIHIVMYYYYYRTAMGARIWWKKYLTKMQITQFMIDIAVITSATYSGFAFRYLRTLPTLGDCAGRGDGALVSGGLILTYLGLFIDFYYQTFGRSTSSLLKGRP